MQELPQSRKMQNHTRSMSIKVFLQDTILINSRSELGSPKQSSQIGQQNGLKKSIGDIRLIRFIRLIRSGLRDDKIIDWNISGELMHECVG